jgi:predicted aspartyl protease
MFTPIGYLDDNGHPRVTIRITGTHPSAFADVDAMIDTGFTGFLMLSIAQALPLGLALYGTGDYVLADGSPISCFLAEGTVEIRPLSRQSAEPPVIEPVTGVVVLGGDGALLGMEFIRSLKKWLVVGSSVMLADESAIPG